MTLRYENPTDTPLALTAKKGYITSGWASSFETHDVTVPPGSVVEVQVRFDAPAGLRYGMAGEHVVRVSPRGEDAHAQKAYLVAKAAPALEQYEKPVVKEPRSDKGKPEAKPGASSGIHLALTPEWMEAPAGEVAQYLLRVKNTGHREETVLLKAVGDTAHLRVMLANETVTLGPGAEARIPVVATAGNVPAAAAKAYPGKTETVAFRIKASIAEAREKQAETKGYLRVVNAQLPASGTNPAEPAAPAPKAPLEAPYAPGPSYRSEVTPTGYRFYLPVSDGAFNLPLKLTGRLEGNLLVLDLHIEGAAPKPQG